MVAGRALGALVMLIVLMAGCHADVTTTTEMRPDGSGNVSVELVLDADAVAIAQAGSRTLETRIVTSDLAAGGWEVGTWERRANGSAALTIRKPFQDPMMVQSIVREIVGPTGVLSEVRASRDADLVSVRWKYSGTLDMTSARIGVLADSELVASIRQAGGDPEQVQRLLDGGTASNVTVRNRVFLPDALPQEWVGQPGARTVMQATARRTDWRRIALFAGGGALLVLAIGVFLGGEARQNRAARHAR